ncbi:uncharacterized protein [Typha angustifolia]|uniref:uncharacterized protein n=1 Tax=Typha angustifolia TaxID=59011 RepID=UPI003C2BF214
MGEETAPAPWLVVLHRKKKQKLQTFFSLAANRASKKSIAELQKHNCVPTPQGWLAIIHSSSRRCSLLNPLTSEEVELPQREWDSEPDYQSLCTLSGPPTDPNCTVLYADYEGWINGCVWLCHPKGDKWFMQRLHPDGSDVSGVAAVGGKLYALFWQDSMVTVDFSACSPITTSLEMAKKKMPTGAYGCNSYLVESMGDILCVEEYVFDHSNDTGHVAVYKMDSKGAWKEVDSIGDRVFFLGPGLFAASWSASELGLKSNSVYIIKPKDLVYVFNIEAGTVSVLRPCPNLCLRTAPFWIVPQRE